MQDNELSYAPPLVRLLASAAAPAPIKWQDAYQRLAARSNLGGYCRNCGIAPRSPRFGGGARLAARTKTWPCCADASIRSACMRNRQIKRACASARPEAEHEEAAGSAGELHHKPELVGVDLAGEIAGAKTHEQHNQKKKQKKKQQDKQKQNATKVGAA